MKNEQYHIDQGTADGSTLAYNNKDIFPIGSVYLYDPKFCTIVPNPRHLRKNTEIKDSIISLKEGEDETALSYEFSKYRKSHVLRTNKSCWVNIVPLREEKDKIKYTKKKI